MNSNKFISVLKNQKQIQCESNEFLQINHMIVYNVSESILIPKNSKTWIVWVPYNILQSLLIQNHEYINSYEFISIQTQS